MDNLGFNIQLFVESPAIVAVEGLVDAINASVIDWLDPVQLTLLFENRDVLPLSEFVFVGEDQSGPRRTFTPHTIRGHGHVFNSTIAVAFEGHGQVYVMRTIRRRQLYGISTIIHYRLPSLLKCNSSAAHTIELLDLLGLCHVPNELEDNLFVVVRKLHQKIRAAMRRRRSLRLCNKKRKTDEDPRDDDDVVVVVVIPADIVMKILNLLPVDFVTRCLLVSKSWQQIIRNKVFIRSFPLFQPSSPPLRILMGFKVEDPQTGLFYYNVFTSSSSLSSSSTSISTSFQSRMPHRPFGSPKLNPRAYYPLYYVNGLINIGECIFNPCTGKTLFLPHLKTVRSTFVQTFFGYDPVNDEYKVMSMSKKMKDAHPWWTDFHVLTLVANQESYWRVIHSSVPHRPRTSGLCMDGAVYYIAHTGTEGQQSLVRFDLKTEKFDIFAGVSETIQTYQRPLNLINYYGKVAVAIQPIRYETRVDFFVFQAGKKDVLERSLHNLPHPFLSLRGINHYTGELVFAPCISTDEAYVFMYDLKEGTFKDITIEVDARPRRNHFSEAMYFLGYVESLMLL
ncbi:unnamed protein product [Cochlearia groenlandica]